jgi:hypothetical protein
VCWPSHAPVLAAPLLSTHSPAHQPPPPSDTSTSTHSHPRTFFCGTLMYSRSPLTPPPLPLPLCVWPPFYQHGVFLPLPSPFNAKKYAPGQIPDMSLQQLPQPLRSFVRSALQAAIASLDLRQGAGAVRSPQLEILGTASLHPPPTHAYMHVRTDSRTHRHTHMHIRTHSRTHRHTHTCTHMHMHMHTHTQIRTQTWTQTQTRTRTRTCTSSHVMLCCVLCMPDVYVLAGTIAMFGTIEVCVVPLV